ncbi:tRNA (adenine(22)-N(1))-methyltransferase [Ruminococcus albus]|uniref:tRNA (Adenine22-N1)-methyltransferase n=1 Tax=Ruminococcus albus (strain ATCC 27210 / DSM 20455 / JCM 14654 / NCDO 2250 / 7) TaxID=697329 RepID=E6UCB0_RUMA7|nr:class I SAM-dependent methyltransferase [Ruminococcus albus]ADU20702.1 protein of unknown function DUF633 [Ruminococcus albus 7 = DSM 20455]
MDKRLLTCVSLCRGRVIADIGTDHGYLPCYMAAEGLCDKAYACDVAEKPLESAAAHISQNGLEDKVTPILSCGLEKVPAEGLTDIVIAGMGGELIARILEDCRWLKTAEPALNLVLQPMTKWDTLRRWLYENGFEVRGEKPCTSGRFVYSVMQAVYTGEKPGYPCDLRYLFCGRVTADDDDGREYLLRQAVRLEACARGKLSSGEADAAKEMQALAEDIKEQCEKNCL